MSVLEFLRAGVPVAGYAVEGPAETLPPDAGLRFAAGGDGGTDRRRPRSVLRRPGPA